MNTFALSCCLKVDDYNGNRRATTKGARGGFYVHTEIQTVREGAPGLARRVVG
jgi:hypothetical protein